MSEFNFTPQDWVPFKDKEIMDKLLEVEEKI